MHLLKRPFLPVINSLGRRIEKRRFTDPPVFIGGCARSGTTLLLSILSSHKELFCIPKELSLFLLDSRDRSGNTYPTRIYRLYRSMLFYRIPKTARRWCEKTPENIRHIDKIDAYYGGRFRIIHIIRDGRDVILSKHPTARERYWVSPQRWIRDVSRGLEYINHPNVHTLKYEDLIQDFENSVTAICTFLGIELTEEILNWHGNATVTRNRALYTRVAQVNNSSVGKWKDPRHAERVEALTGDPKGMALLKTLGYL